MIWSRIDRETWTRHRNPIPVLSGPGRLEPPPRRHDLHGRGPGRPPRVRRLHGERLRRTGSRRTTAAPSTGPIAYFCAEYGFYESLGIYSGGLGVLAGDHTKTTSDMALPFVGVGLLYRNGYFHQTIDADGHQEHAYPDYDLTRLPVSRVQGRDGEPLQVSASSCRAATSTIAVWLAQVGRTPVLLLDTDIPENGDADRPITHILYVRGREMRLHQELVLGVGGVRALRALGIEPVGLAPQRGPLGVPARRAGPRVRRRPARRSTTPWTASAPTASSRSTRRSRPATSASRPTSSGASPGPLLEGDGRPRPAACRSTASSSSASASTATRASST